MTGLLSISDLSYGLPSGQEILSNIGLAVEPTEMVWVSGPSGGGKTTLLRLINRLISPSKGKLSLAGKDYADWPIPALRRSVALLSQTPLMLPGTVGENLALPFRFKAAGGTEAPGNGQMQKTLDRLGLNDLKPDRRVTGLSVGQCQRIALARLLFMHPKALLLDEPLAALDEVSRGLVQKEAARFAKGGGAVIMVSHITPHDGSYLHYRLEDGRLMRDGKEAL